VAGDDSNFYDAPTTTAEQTARSDALELIARKPFTEGELRARLQQRGHAAAAVKSVIEGLKRSGQLDDDRLALHFILTRSDRLGHGPLRLVEELVQRGLSAHRAERVWREAVDRGDVDPGEMLRRQLRRRLGEDPPRLDRRGYLRVYNALLRAGFDAEAIEAELTPFRDPTEVLDEVGDDFA
jgi:regulatory protein